MGDMASYAWNIEILELLNVTTNQRVRITVRNMPTMSEVVVEFDADNPGRWPLHRHHLYHMAAGTVSFVSYDDEH